METQSPGRQFWIAWLLVVSAGVAVFGLGLVLLPALTRQAFSLIVYASPSSLDAFGAEQVRYLSLVHAVLGGVMAGWGCLLFLVARELMQSNHPCAWRLMTGSLLAWFIPDTAYSLLSGYWQNGVLNGVFLLLFAIPLLALRRGQGNRA